MEILNHLKNRNFSLDFKFWFNEETITFPLYKFNGQLVGYQQYRPNGSKKLRRNPKDGKYFTYSSEPSVWGLNEIEFNECLIVCEGIFKACRFISHGIPAIATLTNNPSHLSQQLRLVSEQTKLIVIPDPDDAGKKLMKYGSLAIVPEKPVDELNEIEFKKLIKEIGDLI